jgi:methylated-DNA-[protein]-cysteine S-methyltransferase
VTAAVRASCVTPFARRVYAALARVPRGRVTTYGELARAAGCASARAVGRALRENPFAPRVPCHRVIASDLTAGGYQGARRGAALRRKLALLAREGVRFAGGRLAEPARLVRFPRG